MPEKKQGLTAAVDMLHDSEQKPETAASQLPLPMVAADESDALAPDTSASDPAERKAGRPAGALNKRTEDWAQYLLSRYRSPLIGLAEIYSRPVAQLAMDLGFAPEELAKSPGTLVELFRVQVDAFKAILPYVHCRKPVELDISERKSVALTVVIDGDESGQSVMPTIEITKDENIVSDQ